MIRIRPAGPADVAAMSELKRRAAWSNREDRALLAAHPEKAGGIDMSLAVKVLEEDGKLRAFIGTAATGDGPVRIDELFSDPGHFRRGFARQLVSAVIDAARGDGCAGLRVDANPAAVPFYRAMGFVDAAQNPEHAGTSMELPLL